MLNVLQKQESEGEDTLWREQERTRETPFSTTGNGYPGPQSPKAGAAAPIQEVVSDCAASGHPGFSST